MKASKIVFAAAILAFGVTPALADWGQVESPDDWMPFLNVTSVNETVACEVGTYAVADTEVSDSVVITRSAAGTGDPFVDATNADAMVAYEMGTYTVDGTNNSHVVGGMWMTNELAGGASTSFAATSSWTAPSLSLAVGANTIIVYGTNAYGTKNGDSVVITRSAAGTGTPFVDMTNAPATVAYEVGTYAVAGTNNVHVVGDVWVMNGTEVISFSAAAPWTWTLTLTIGANTIYVCGTNAAGTVASDSVVITRSAVGTGTPFIDVTNADETVAYEAGMYAVAGTNNVHVVGGMWVSNGTEVTSFSAATPWNRTVTLAIGSNTIYVCGTNAVGTVASDSVVITRGTAGTGTPFVDVTNAPATVAYEVGTYTVAGTNNVHVVGGMWVSNGTVVTSFSAATPWTRTVTLAIGANKIYVCGTNAYGAPARDLVVITRNVGTGDYCIIDVSAGPTAASYKVSYQATAPPTNDEYKTAKIVLRRISTGSFVMGSPTAELGRFGNETQHTVTLSSNFYMGVFEITQGQYSNVMGANPSYFPHGAHGQKRPVEQVSWNTVRGGTWPTGVLLNTTFMGKLQSKTGLPFDLPTEAQWEYACRAGTTNALNNNTNLISTDQDPNMDILGRYWHNGGYAYATNPVSGAHTTVGSYQVNNWGLYDMHGNVWEWCLDWYQSDLGAGSATNPPGAATGTDRVVRGGRWGAYASYCRSASRIDSTPGGTRLPCGFRVSLPAAQ